MDLEIKKYNYRDLDDALKKDLYNFIYSNGTIFHQPEYLNVIGSECIVLIARIKNKIIACFSLTNSKKFFLKGFFIPPYTYLYGPVFLKDDFVNKKQISLFFIDILKGYSFYEIKSTSKDFYEMCFQNSSVNLKFSNTYVVKYNSDFNEKNIHSSKRRYLKKLLLMLSQKKIYIKHGESCNSDLLLLQEKTAKKSNFNARISVLKKIINNLKSKQYFSFVIYSSSGTPLSGSLCLVDKNCVYYLINASVQINDSLLNRVNILSTFLTIKKAMELKLNFDFEGSDIRSIASYYQQMGGVQSKNYRIQVHNNIFGKLIFNSQNLIKEKIYGE